MVYCQIGFFDIQDPEIFGRCTMSVKGLFSRLRATKIGIWDVLVGIALGGQFGGHFWFLENVKFMFHIFFVQV